MKLSKASKKPIDRLADKIAVFEFKYRDSIIRRTEEEEEDEETKKERRREAILEDFEVFDNMELWEEEMKMWGIDYSKVSRTNLIMTHKTYTRCIMLRIRAG
jgi:hypothetical protein